MLHTKDDSTGHEQCALINRGVGRGEGGCVALHQDNTQKQIVSVVSSKEGVGMWAWFSKDIQIVAV